MSETTVMWNRSAGLVAIGFAAAMASACGTGARPGPSAPSAATTQLPAAIADSVYWRLSSDLSEPGGSFSQSDNYVSNEGFFQDILPRLQATTRPAGVYIGVGPEQNFTYIAALRPRLAFIIDIRREAIVQHLLYKAIFELSADRADFVSRLFSKRRPASLRADASVGAIFSAYASVPADADLFDQNLAAVDSVLRVAHHFPLNPTDVATLRSVYHVFFQLGPSVTYMGPSPLASGWPNFRQLAEAPDSAGVQRGFLANEDNYRVVRSMHLHNLIILVVGDFGGPKAIRAVGAYLKAHRATVTAFYTSNVEQYLFAPNDSWRQFYANIGELPLDATSVLLRAIPAPPVVLQADAQYRTAHPLDPGLTPEAFRAGLARIGIQLPSATACVAPPPPRVEVDTERAADGTITVRRTPVFHLAAGTFGDQSVCLASMMDLVRAFNAGLVQRYSQAVALDK